ncbi:MAG: 3-hydroxyacyl-ACP dehydratase FabZ [Alphaproteobacteria bacterium]|nr:3-hydroxyacyl-ACP dehydratase FabZ [Alphaproteobacteria bacterium]
MITDDADIAEIGEVMATIPHRYPFLMIDRVTEIRLGESAVGIKNVSINEMHFQGHFPSKPVMPGVLLVEAMAQTAAVLVEKTMGEHVRGKLVYFMTIDNARFRRPVVPGDQVRVEVAVRRHRGAVWRFRGEAKVDGVLAAEAEYSAMIQGL